MSYTVQNSISDMIRSRETLLKTPVAECSRRPVYSSRLNLELLDCSSEFSRCRRLHLGYCYVVAEQAKPTQFASYGDSYQAYISLHR